MFSRVGLRGLTRGGSMYATILPRCTPCVLPVNSSPGISQRRYKSDAAAAITTEIASLGDQASAVVAQVPPDQIGYFASVGLAQSWWWPPGLFQHVFEMTHIFTGLPWWATILAVSLTLRACMMPLYLSASDSSAKMARVKPQLTVIMEKTKRATEQADIQKAMISRKQLMNENNISILSMGKPVLAVPVFLGVFGALEGMSKVPVAGFTTEGFAWFPDLAAADPYCGLQIITAVVYAATFKYLGGETGAQQMSPAMKKVITFMPFIAVPLTMNLPAGVCLYFAINSLFAVFQSGVLKSSRVRKWLKLAPLVTAEEQRQINAEVAKVTNSAGESDSIIGMVRKKYDDAKSQAERRVEQQEKERRAESDYQESQNRRYAKVGKKSRR